MCTNFTSTTNNDWVRRHFAKDLPRTDNPEVFPGQKAAIAFLDARGDIQIELGQFGLLPAWVDELRAKTFHRHTYNARMESVQTKPSFRQAWRKAQFAVLILDDFFEPCYETGVAVRHRIQTTLDEPFGIACLWDRWSGSQDNHGLKSGAETGRLSFAMLTLNADHHPVMSRMHPPEDEKRTPWVLGSSQFETWLKALPSAAHDLAQLHLMPPLKTQADPSPRISSKSNNSQLVDKKKKEDLGEGAPSSSDQLSLF